MENQSKIKSLKFPDNIRQMPYMMLGDLNDSSILLREIFDNSRDELIASQSCDTIHVWNNSNLYLVIDNGRGISIESSDDDPEITQMELAVGSIYAGGKYDSEVVAGGMHGVGSSAVNAVSNVFRIACKIKESSIEKSNTLVRSYYTDHSFNNEYLFIEFHKGIKVIESIIDPEGLKVVFENDQIPTDFSTYVGFTPDDTIVKSIEAPFNDSWHEYTYVVLDKFYDKKINIYVNGENRSSNFTPYKYEVCKTFPLHWAGKNKEISLYINFEFDHDLSVQDWSGSVNMITVNSGLHINMAHWMITYNLKKYFGIKHKHVSEGLKYNVVLLAKKVGYNSQTKDKLVKIENLSDDDWYQLDAEITKIFDDNYDEIYEHVQRLNEYAASLESLAVRDYIKKTISIASEQGQSYARSYVPKKLKDCSSPNREDCELLIVEGESAGGSIMSVRNPSTQAVMGLRGKSLNTTFRTLEDIFENPEVKDIISAIGMGVDEYNDTSTPRYGKIIICCFTGDTKIPLVDGTTHTIEELYDSKRSGGFEVYSYDEVNRRIVPGYVTEVIKTRTVNKILRLHLDNGTYVDSTLDHKYLLRDGSWVEAQDLKSGDSLECLWLSTENNYLRGYKMVWQNYCDKYKFVHREFCIKESEDAKNSDDQLQVHHIDHNPLNNSTDNLIRLTRSEHCSIHLTEYNLSEERIEYIRSLHQQGVYDHTYFGANGYNGSDAQREMLRKMHEEGRMHDGSVDLIMFNQSEHHKEQVRQMNRDPQIQRLQFRGRIVNAVRKWIESGWGDIDECLDWIDERNYMNFWNYYDSYQDFKDEYNSRNHKVVYSEVLEVDDLPMYCLNVKDYHNFALDNGPIVHNCDADDDGSHITALLMGLFTYHMSFLIEQGFIYILQSPLYVQDGVYYYPGQDDLVDKSRPFDRFKGLGSIETDEMRHEIFVDKDKRRLIRVTKDGIQDAIECIGNKYYRKQVMRSAGLVE